jgi:hypothetical protein
MGATDLLDTDEVLRPLLEAAKESAASNLSTIRAVVLKVLSHPYIFCGFDQIKAILQPAASSSGGEMGEALLRTLDLFSYGTYHDYVTNPSSYLNLTETQVNKLRQLTVLAVVQDTCARGASVISYKVLAHELGLVSSGNNTSEPSDNKINNTDETSRLLRQVEQVVISCIYAQILSGRLCQKTQTLLVSSSRGPPCRSRDVALDKIPLLTQKLQALYERLDQTQEELQAAHKSVQTSVNANTSYWAAVDERKKTAESQMERSQSGGGTVRSMAGWPGGASSEGGVDGSRRSSGSRRQSKRSRGGRGGSFTEPFQRY